MQHTADIKLSDLMDTGDDRESPVKSKSVLSLSPAKRGGSGGGSGGGSDGENYPPGKNKKNAGGKVKSGGAGGGGPVRPYSRPLEPR